MRQRDTHCRRILGHASARRAALPARASFVSAPATGAAQQGQHWVISTDGGDETVLHLLAAIPRSITRPSLCRQRRQLSVSPFADLILLPLLFSSVCPHDLAPCLLGPRNLRTSSMQKQSHSFYIVCARVPVAAKYPCNMLKARARAHAKRRSVCIFAPLRRRAYTLQLVVNYHLLLIYTCTTYALPIPGQIRSWPRVVVVVIIGRRR